jgi:hypothetical protein
VVHDDNLEHPAHKQEARRTTTIDFKFPRSPKNSATTFQSAIRKTSYEKIDRRSNATTDRDFINDYPIILVSPHRDLNNKA